MAVLGAGSGTGFPGVVDTAQTYANISTPDPDDNTRVDAAFANDIMAALLALETSIPKFIVAGPTVTRTYTFPDANGSVPLLAVANVFTANQTISNTAPSLVLTDTTASAKSLKVAVDANIVDLRESAGASGSLLVLDLANNNVGIGTTAPGSLLELYANAGGSIAPILRLSNAGGGAGTGSALDFLQSTQSQPISARISTLPGGGGFSPDILFSTKADASGGAITERVRIAYNGNVGIGMTPTYQLQLSTDSAAKPTTNTWTIASDANMKDASKQRPYERGLDLIRALPTPHYWTYNGKADTPEGVESMGWNAQDLEVIAPKMVRRTRGKLTPAREKRVNEKGQVELVPVPKEIVDALPETDLLGINTHELIYAMFNAIRELDASVKALKEKP